MKWWQQQPSPGWIVVALVCIFVVFILLTGTNPFSLDGVVWGIAFLGMLLFVAYAMKKGVTVEQSHAGNASNHSMIVYAVVGVVILLIAALSLIGKPLLQ